MHSLNSGILKKLNKNQNNSLPCDEATEDNISSNVRIYDNKVFYNYPVDKNFSFYEISIRIQHFLYALVLRFVY